MNGTSKRNNPFPAPPFGGLRRRTGGFTLIEMLVVVVIIAILAATVFRLSRAVMARSANARETAQLAILKGIIEEFHSEYGIYPPVPEYGGAQPVSFTGPFPEDSQDLIYYIQHYAGSDIFQFGLLSFFVDRSDFGSQTFEIAGRNGNPEARASWERYNDELGDGGSITVSSKDKAFAERVKPMLDKLHNASLGAGSAFDKDGHTLGFDVQVLDAWFRPYIYISEPPYTSCLIFSTGPDGQYDHSAPGDRTLKKNKDNIYGDLLDK